jgi:hypothetical protein
VCKSSINAISNYLKAAQIKKKRWHEATNQIQKLESKEIFLKI